MKSKRIDSFLVRAFALFLACWLPSAPVSFGAYYYAAAAGAPAGGPDVWFDSIAPGAANNYSQVANEGSFGVLGATVTVTTGGSATKVRVYFGFQNNSSDHCKASLFSNTGTLLGSGIAQLTGATDAYLEVTLAAPVTVASATNYVVAYMVEGSGSAQGRELTGQAAGTGRDNFSEAYATFPSGNLTFGNSTNQQVVSIYVD